MNFTGFVNRFKRNGWKVGLAGFLGAAQGDRLGEGFTAVVREKARAKVADGGGSSLDNLDLGNPPSLCQIAKINSSDLLYLPIKEPVSSSEEF